MNVLDVTSTVVGPQQQYETKTMKKYVGTRQSTASVLRMNEEFHEGLCVVMVVLECRVVVLVLVVVMAECYVSGNVVVVLMVNAVGQPNSSLR